ncbi:MAG TPA: hypothetical protein ACYCC8_00950 [Candidatus Azoamicus sp.]
MFWNIAFSFENVNFILENEELAFSDINLDLIKQFNILLDKIYFNLLHLNRLM